MYSVVGSKFLPQVSTPSHDTTLNPPIRTRFFPLQTSIHQTYYLILRSSIHTQPINRHHPLTSIFTRLPKPTSKIASPTLPKPFHLGRSITRVRQRARIAHPPGISQASLSTTRRTPATAIGALGAITNIARAHRIPQARSFTPTLRQGYSQQQQPQRGMKIATLQFAPRLGDVEGNVRRADELLGGLQKGVELLVLPEMALTGYNFPSADAIRPYVEHVGQGPSADWARKTAKQHGCKVCVGYPEVEKTTASSESATATETYYNSLVVVDPHGSVLVNYRKTFLYMADEPWAAEGDAGRSFHRLQFGTEGEKERRIATSFGICMDINPYKFEAPFTAFEFARRVVDSQTQLVVLSMAWTTMLPGDELRALGASPDLDTFNYWIQRFMPLIRERMAHGADVDGNGGEGAEKRVVLVFANRCGEDPAAIAGQEPVRYAGGSTIIAVSQRRRRGAALTGGDDGSDLDVKILCWGMMGAATDGICFADTEADPEMVFALVKPGG